MSSPLEELRSVVEAGTPGPWHVPEDSYRDTPTGGSELDPDYNDINGRGWTALAKVVKRVDGEPSKQGEVNAALIISSVRLARAVADPGMVEELAKVIDEARKTSVIPAPTIGELWQRKAATAILSHLARIAMGGSK